MRTREYDLAATKRIEMFIANKRPELGGEFVGQYLRNMFDADPFIAETALTLILNAGSMSATFKAARARNRARA